MASKDDSDKENLFKGKISDRTRSKSPKRLKPEREKELAALNKIRKNRETGERPNIPITSEKDVFKSISEKDYRKKVLEDKNCIVGDNGDGEYLTDGKEIVDNCYRGKGNEAHSERFTLKPLEGTQIYKCYGCGTSFREKPKGGKEIVPPAPSDVVLKRKHTREYYHPNTKELTASKAPEFCYYHISLDCILKKNPKFKKEEVCISKREWSKKLSSSHKHILGKEFGIRNYTCNEDH